MQSAQRIFIVVLSGAGALFVLVVLMGFFFALDPGAYEDKLVGGYVVRAGETINEAAICQQGIQVIPPMVCGYGWNDDFIVARRHGALDGRAIDLYTPHWYLIEVHSAKIHGPLTEQQFLSLRRELKVPDTLAFTKTLQPH
jgi:hypothetical protein